MMTAIYKAANRAVPPVAAAEENEARSALYGVLAHLFFAAPTRELLDGMASSRSLLDHPSPAGLAWQALCDAAATADAAQVQDEFNAVFVSTARPLVSLYASTYMSSARRGQILADLRGDLARAGYVRSTDSTEYEDHVSALCDVMRGLIAEDAGLAGGAAAQQAFFNNYLAPWYATLCDTICRAEPTRFYRLVARFANAYFTNEAEYFDLA